MIKWFAYIVLLLIMAPGLSLAKKTAHSRAAFHSSMFLPAPAKLLKDTTAAKNVKHQQDLDDKKKIKEIAKARRQPKPEKLIPADGTTPPKQKPKRQHRPEGLEQPPEIPRRNDN
jgi:Ni,Fe-hydrogenase I large subunit